MAIPEQVLDLLAGRNSHETAGILTDLEGLSAQTEALQQPLKRLISALQETREKYRPGWADILTLLRHVLRADQELHEGQSRLTAIQCADQFPSPIPWDNFGFEHIRTDGSLHRVRIRPWRPEWLANSQSGVDTRPARRRSGGATGISRWATPS